MSTCTFVISFVISSADAETAVLRITEITTTSAMVNAKILFAFIFFLLFVFLDNRRGWPRRCLIIAYTVFILYAYAMYAHHPSGVIFKIIAGDFRVIRAE